MGILSFRAYLISCSPLTGEGKKTGNMVNEAGGKTEVDKETVVNAIKAVKDKGWDINPFTVADEAKVAAAEVYRSSEYMDMISRERGNPITVDVPAIDALKKTLKDTEQRVRQLTIQNEVLTMQQQTQYELGHKLGIIEGKKIKAAEYASQDAGRTQDREALKMPIDRAGGRQMTSNAAADTGEAKVIQLAENAYVPDLVSQAQEPAPAARQHTEDEGWDTPEVVGEAEYKVDDEPEEIDDLTYGSADALPEDLIESLKEAEAEANAPVQELEAGIPTAVFLSAVEEQSGAFGDSYSQKVFNAARSGPFVASEFNPLLELSWKDLETVYHFRAKSLKDFSKQMNQPATPSTAAGAGGGGSKIASQTDTGSYNQQEMPRQRKRVPVDSNGGTEAVHVDEVPIMPSESLTGDNWERYEAPPAEIESASLSGGYAPSPDETTQEPHAYTHDAGDAGDGGHSGQTGQAGQAVDVESADGESNFDLDSMDIFEGLDEYSNLEDIEIIQDVQLSPDGRPANDDELRDLIKNRIKQAQEVTSEPRESHISPSAKGEAAAAAEHKGGLGSKFVGGKKSKGGDESSDQVSPSASSQASSQQPVQTPPPRPGNSAVGGASSTGTPQFQRVIPPEIRKACMILGVRQEDMTIESVTEAWKRQISSPGVHPDQGGDTESAIYLNTAKDTIVRWLYDQAPKLGKKFGKDGGKGGPPR